MREFLKILSFVFLIMLLSMLFGYIVAGNKSNKIICPRCDYKTTIANFKCKNCGYLIPNFTVDLWLFKSRFVDVDQLEEDRAYFKSAED